MVIEIKMGSGEGEIRKAMLKLKKKKKPFDPSKHFGKAKWDIDGLEYQRKVRDEWK